MTSALTEVLVSPAGGRFALLRRLAVGGMAEVFLARAYNPGGRPELVAIKQMLPQLASNRQNILMFIDEARIAASFRHPNLVEVLDISAARAQQFFVMEYLDGIDALELLKLANDCGRTVPLGVSLSIIVAAARGIDYAHSRTDDRGRPLGIVHRDISPRNLFVTHDGRIKVLDFGIAKASRRSSETQAGVLKGKIRYMSPEQCRAEPLDRRSDVFSLSIVMWELTTEQPLYNLDTEIAMTRLLRDANPPRPSKVKTGYPAELDEIVMAGLERERDDRIASGRDLATMITSFARRSGIELGGAVVSRFLGEIAKTDRKCVRSGPKGTRVGDTIHDTQLRAAVGGVAHASVAAAWSDRTQTTLIDVVRVSRASDRTSWRATRADRGPRPFQSGAGDASASAKSS
jgi:serine/threonine protein kinase